MTALPWFKVHSTAPEHLKMLALVEELSEPLADAYVLRLWAFCARTQPDGRFHGAGAARALERAVHWLGQPGQLTAALVKVGLLDEEEGALVVHEWTQEQSAHVEKRERDKERARARRASRDSRATSRRVAATSGGPSPSLSLSQVVAVEGVQGEAAPEPDPEPRPEQLQAAWNELTSPPIPRCEELNDFRRTQAKRALERRSLEQWREVFQRISKSPFCQGETGWKADFDWAIRPAGRKQEPAQQVLEGRFERAYGPAPPARPADVTRGVVRAEAARHAPPGEIQDF